MPFQRELPQDESGAGSGAEMPGLPIEPEATMKGRDLYHQGTRGREDPRMDKPMPPMAQGDFFRQWLANLQAHPLWPGLAKLLEAAQMSGWGPPGLAGYRSTNPVALRELPEMLKLGTGETPPGPASKAIYFPEFQKGGKTIAEEGVKAGEGNFAAPGASWNEAELRRRVETYLKQALGPAYTEDLLQRIFPNWGTYKKMPAVVKAPETK